MPNVSRSPAPRHNPEIDPLAPVLTQVRPGPEPGTKVVELAYPALARRRAIVVPSDWTVPR